MKYILILIFLIILLSITSTAKEITGTITVLASTPTPMPPSGGSSGNSENSGSSGVASDEIYGNILLYQTVDGQILANKFTTFNFKNTVIYKVTVNGKVNDIFAIMRIENLKSRSNRTPIQPEGEVYMFVNAYLNTVRINNATLSFKIPLSWLTENNIQSIKMLVWTNGTWVSLPITVMGKDSEYAHFEAITEHLSNFVIVGKTASIVIPTPTVITTTNAPITTANVENIPIITPIAAPTKEPKKSSGFGTISTVFVLFGIIYMTRRKN